MELGQGKVKAGSAAVARLGGALLDLPDLSADANCGCSPTVKLLRVLPCCSILYGSSALALEWY